MLMPRMQAVCCFKNCLLQSVGKPHAQYRTFPSGSLKGPFTVQDTQVFNALHVLN
jgi:hypothetical protein